jgi:hypothetical protein
LCFCPARVALAPALAPARGMLGRVLYAAAFFLLLRTESGTAVGVKMGEWICTLMMAF